MRLKTKNRRGFTLIEISIVLAIAGGLMLLVFLSVSGAQKAKRDEIRKAEAGKIMSALQSYLENNSNSFYSPPASHVFDAFTGADASYLGNMIDPSTGQPPEFSGNTPLGPNPGNGHGIYIDYTVAEACRSHTVDLSQPTAMVPAGLNDYAVAYYVESGNTVVCVDNHG